MHNICEEIAERISRFAGVLVICFITLSVVFVARIAQRGSKFESFDQNVKFDQDLLGKDRNSTVQNVTVPFVEGPKENVTVQNVSNVSDFGSRNGSFISFKNNTKSSKPVKSVSNKATDNPLEGLLSPEFDRESCLSRHQSHLYHKSRLPNPASHLISKLRAYENLHARCGPNSKSYKRAIRSLSRNTHVKAATSCKYLVWTASNGLGNRLVSLGSAFLYSLLTDRVLLVEFDKAMNDLFCEPFPSSSWTLPSDFPYGHHWDSLITFKTLVSEDNSVTALKFLHLNLQHSSDGDRNLGFFQCDRTQMLLSKAQVLVLQTDQYFVPSLFMVPGFKTELTKMFPNKGIVFYYLGHYLFSPSNEVWGLITRFYDSYLANVNEKIGFQIRIFNTKQTSFESIMTQITSCALKNKVLPELDMQKPMSMSSKNHTTKTKAVMIASLYPEYAEKLRVRYHNRQTITGDTIQVIQASHEGKQRFNDKEHNMKAWAEIYLLSLCDVLVTSSQSTFGYAAQGLGGLNPWVLNKFGKRIPNLPCKRDFSAEPCFHVSPKNDCNNKKINVSALVPPMRQCVDVWWGLKMAND